MIAQIVSTEVVLRKTSKPYGVFTVKSQSNPAVEYRVDITNGRCSCPAWTRSRPVDGQRPLCKHLISVGYSENTTTV